jgi:metal-sulfur cluster biosynthetic enzyme
MSEQLPSSNRVAWDSEIPYPDLSDRLRDGLRAVKDPELNLDIIQLGLVRNVIISEDNAVVKMLLTTPFCPYGPELLEQTRVKAEELLDRSVHMDLGFEPWDFSMMEDGAMPDWGLYG